MRVLGRGAASLEGGAPRATGGASAAADATPAVTAAGPAVFVPAVEVQAPEEDRKLVDASRLTVMQAVEGDADAAVMAGGVTAFSRQRDRVGGLGKQGAGGRNALMPLDS
jgi:hypothetical protein